MRGKWVGAIVRDGLAVQGHHIPLDPSTGLRVNGPALGDGFRLSATGMTGLRGLGGVGGGLLLGHGTKTSWDFRLTSAAFDRKTAASNLPAVSCWNDVPFPPQKK